MKYLVVATALICVLRFCSAEDPKIVTVQPGDRVVVELFDKAAIKYLSEVRDHFPSDHYVVPILCTVESVDADGKVLVSGFEETETLYVHPRKEKEPRVLAIRLSFNMGSLKKRRGVDEYSDPLMDSTAVRSLPNVLFADPDALTVTSWKQVSKDAVSQ